jgi:predicted SAM-dependent methyltransferase
MKLKKWIKRTVFVPGKRVVSQSEIERYLRRTDARKINVGAGGNRAQGWLNLDLDPAPGITYMDASQRWPFEDRSLDAILCEHMIEHVPKELARYMFREMRRTLKPRHWVRVVTPDLNWFAQRILAASSRAEDGYLQFLNSFLKRDRTTWCDAVNLCFYEHGHRYIWSTEELQAELRAAGFQDSVVTRAAQPEQTVFADVEGHPRLIGEVNDALEAFAIEARYSDGGGLA